MTTENQVPGNPKDKLLKKFIPRDGTYELAYKDLKGNRFVIGTNPNRPSFVLYSPHGYWMDVDYFDPTVGYLGYYGDKEPPVMKLLVVPSEPILRDERWIYEFCKTYDCMGQLVVDPQETVWRVGSRSLAEFKIREIHNLGHFSEEELPEQIDIKATIEALVKQARQGKFEKPRLIVSGETENSRSPLIVTPKGRDFLLT